jgi:signal transduction histidine kinase/predicted CoA-binding protein
MDYEFLRKIPLFADLSVADLDRVCQVSEEISLPAGEILFREGDPGDKAYIIQNGQVEILKTKEDRLELIALVQTGNVIGEMSLLEAVPRNATVRARTDCSLISIGSNEFNEMINHNPASARTMLTTVASRLRSTEVVLRQSEKMAQIGILTAGIAHELNNPSAAARRGSEQLRESLSELQRLQFTLGQSRLSEEQIQIIGELGEFTRSQAGKSVVSNSLDRFDKQEIIEDWLNRNDVENSWELAPVLVDLELSEESLENLSANFSENQLTNVITWIVKTFDAQNLLTEIMQGTSRIGEIVKALKSYVYFEQAPLQSIDVHEGINNSLVILRSKLKQGITISYDFAADLPKIQAYGSELDQVWTNLIDNAIDAMNGKGVIILRSKLDGNFIVVEIEDHGPGIPLEAQKKLFSPFFTTKPVGKGTGLGLNISYNIVQKHNGDMKFFSRPGKTIFQVWLPIEKKDNSNGIAALPGVEQVDDECLLKILQQIKTIAVVGISVNPDVPAFSVPRYLIDHGYRIIGVNPNLNEFSGEKVYPDLLSISVPVDAVLVFRRSEVVPKIVEDAIHIGAKTIWMTQGVINHEAASMAQDAGLQVVMDTCMRATHKRLLGTDFGNSLGNPALDPDYNQI